MKMSFQKRRYFRAFKNNTDHATMNEEMWKNLHQGLSKYLYVYLNSTLSNELVVSNHLARN